MNNLSPKISSISIEYLKKRNIDNINNYPKEFMIRITIIMKSLINHIRIKFKIQFIDSNIDRIIDIFINRRI